MVYPIWCVMPSDRVVYVDDNEQVKALEGYVDTCLAEESAISSNSSTTSSSSSQHHKVYLKDAGHTTGVLMTNEEIARHFGFIHTKFLVFTHEKLLREVLHLQYTVAENEEVATSWGEAGSRAGEEEGYSLQSLIVRGYVHPDLSIRYIGEVDGYDVGHGLFAEAEIPCHAFIGEYVGVVETNSSFDATQQAYCCQYASCSGNMHINALEYGNLIRFINHSQQPNVELRVLQCDGLPHILCVRHSSPNPQHFCFQLTSLFSLTVCKAAHRDGQPAVPSLWRVLLETAARIEGCFATRRVTKMHISFIKYTMGR